MFNLPFYYETFSYRDAGALLTSLNESQDIAEVMTTFVASENDILAAGGGKSLIAQRLNNALLRRGWRERSYRIEMEHEGQCYPIDTHRIDAIKGRVALEIEWNNKDTFYDRDLSAFRLLYSANIIDCAVIITRSSKLFSYFEKLVRTKKLSPDKFVTTTTHFDRLIPRLISGGSGECPVFGIAITEECFKNELPLSHELISFA